MPSCPPNHCSRSAVLINEASLHSGSWLAWICSSTVFFSTCHECSARIARICSSICIFRRERREHTKGNGFGYFLWWCDFQTSKVVNMVSSGSYEQVLFVLKTVYNRHLQWGIFKTYYLGSDGWFILRVWWHCPATGHAGITWRTWSDLCYVHVDSLNMIWTIKTKLDIFR